MTRVLVALLTVVVFLSGYGARVWTEPRVTMPPPPAALAQEYRSTARSASAPNTPQVDRAKLVAEIEKLRPQIEAYTGQVEEINGEFDREFFQVLNAEQREKFTGNQKRWAERNAKSLSERAPLSDEDIVRIRERPLTDIYWMVTVTPRLERLTKEYNLDATQQTNVRALLTLRRNKFIALFDATPHPSIRLSKLAPLIERVSPPPQKPAP